MVFYKRHLPEQFSIVHQNVQCINNKLLELRVFLSDIKCDIFCVSEHSAKKEQIQSINIDGYTLNSYYCRNTFKNGEVCIYIKNNRQCSEISYIKDLC